MLEVAFYKLVEGEDARLGSIRWDGSQFTVFPSGSAFMQEILIDSIGDPLHGKILTAKDNPEEWLAALSRQYKSAYLRATSPKKI